MWNKLILATLVGFAAPATHAGVVVDTTRVIFDEASGEAVVQLHNQGKGPVLVQVWLDEGDPGARPDDVDVPFALTPATARIDEGKDQAVRILQTGHRLPTSRESVLWLNVLEVPPKPHDVDGASPNRMQLAIRSRLKFFYRPRGLALPPEAAIDGLRFTVRHGPGKDSVRVNNASAYHITFRSLALHLSADTPALAILDNPTERMVPPGGELDLPLRTLRPGIPDAARVHFSVFNDLGGETVREMPTDGTEY